MLAFCLQTIALALPSLTSLSVGHCLASLPHPSNFPHLTHIDINTETGAADEVCSSIAPYLAQITSLHLHSYDADMEVLMDYWIHDYIPWRILFQPQQVTHTLTTLSTNAQLTDALVQVILDHAPALRDLTTRRFAVKQDWVRKGQMWGVERLCLSEHVSEINAVSLALLPVTKQGHLLIEIDGTLILPYAVRFHDTTNTHTQARARTHTHTHMHTHRDTHAHRRRERDTVAHGRLLLDVFGCLVLPYAVRYDKQLYRTWWAPRAATHCHLFASTGWLSVALQGLGLESRALGLRGTC